MTDATERFDDGGQAEPTTYDTWLGGKGRGKTLADWFAAQAMIKLCPEEGFYARSPNYEDCLKRVAAQAYDLAEALIAEKRRREKS